MALALFIVVIFHNAYLEAKAMHFQQPDMSRLCTRIKKTLYVQLSNSITAVCCHSYLHSERGLVFVYKMDLHQMESIRFKRDT